MLKMKPKKEIHWVCYPCGIKFGNRKPRGFATYHIGKCDICGKKKAITEIRDFGYFKGEPEQQIKGDYI